MDLSIRFNSGQFYKLENAKRVFLPSTRVQSIQSETKPRVLMITPQIFERYLEKRLIDLFSSTNKSESQLKEIIKRSRFTKVLKSQFQEIALHLQIEVLQTMIECTEPDVIHLKSPDLFLQPGEIQRLLGSLFTYSGSVIVESIKPPLPEFFEYIVTETGLMDSYLPTSMDQINSFENGPRFTLSAQIIQNGTNWILCLDDLNFILPKDDCASMMGLVNQDMLANIGETSLEVSIREKAEGLKVPVKILPKRGLRLLGMIHTGKNTIFVPLPKRPPTPYLWLSIIPEQLYLFHSHTRQRIYPHKS
ncbi:MAG: hypothetical protein H3C47_00850 [Candidatus Cloacimonetes bacterium]|nr:hypothetical protein [Candidatus Cloacimonadota bacterium]